MPSIKEEKQIPLQDILLATNGFAKENIIGEGGFGPVYKGISKKHGCIAVKRLDHRKIGQVQGDQEFKMEITLLKILKHENIISLLGSCDEGGEKILVYKYESNGSLDKHLNNEELTWTQRLWICLDVARGLKYLHDNDGSHEHKIFHRDVKSPNILLDEKWKAKISDFGLSRVCPANLQASFLISHPCGTPGYIDPDYYNTWYLTQKSDVYSFGVVLWEVLCGRLTCVASYNDDHRHLRVLVEKHYVRGILDKIIPSYLHKQMTPDSLRTYSNIAYQCLKNREERPTMKEVVEQLEEAIDHQLEVKKPYAEAKRTSEKEGEDLRDPKPSPSRQEVVLSMYMHCESCAMDVKRCLKGFDGVEEVVTDCETHKVVVKGEKLDPLKILERVKRKSHRKARLLSPILIPLPDELKESEHEESSKSNKNKEVGNLEEREKAVDEAKPVVEYEEMVNESKDSAPPSSSQEIILKVFMHCEDCARKIRQCLKGFEGIEGVVTNCETQMVVVKGKKADPLKVLERVKKKCHRNVELISPIQKHLINEAEKTGKEKPRKQGWMSWIQKI